MYSEINIAKHYANALFVAARSIDACDLLYEQIDMLVEKIASSPSYLKLIYGKAVPITVKMNAIGPIIQEGVLHSFLANTLSLLLENRRMHLLPIIAATYLQLLRQQKNELVMYVQSAVKLSLKQCEEFASIVSKKLNKHVVLKNSVSRNILGGLILKFDNKILDLSMRTKLNNIKNAIARHDFSVSKSIISEIKASA